MNTLVTRTEELLPNAPTLSRRQLLKYAAASPLLLTPLATTNANAALFWTTSLHVVRFVGGLIFNFAGAVLVDITADWIGDKLKTYVQPPLNETKFKHPTYKRAVVHLGLCDAIVHQQRQLALQLVGDQQHYRFEEIHKYLVDKKIRVKLATDSYSHPVKINTPPDDLFTLDYMQIDERDKFRHYENMIARTGVDVFEQWYG